MLLIKDLQKTFSGTGSVTFIGVRPERQMPVEVIHEVIAVAGLCACSPKQQPNESAGKSLKTVRVALTTYPDTGMFLYGIKQGFFEQEGLRLDVKDTTWNEQIEFVAGGGTDIAMASLDEVVAKARSLERIAKSAGIPHVTLKSPRFIFRTMAGELLIHDILVAKIMGHKLEGITYRYQSSISKKVQDQAHLKIIEELFKK